MRGRWTGLYLICRRRRCARVRLRLTHASAGWTKILGAVHRRELPDFIKRHDR